MGNTQSNAFQPNETKEQPGKFRISGKIKSSNTPSKSPILMTCRLLVGLLGAFEDAFGPVEHNHARWNMVEDWANELWAKHDSDVDGKTPLVYATNVDVLIARFRQHDHKHDSSLEHKSHSATANQMVTLLLSKFKYWLPLSDMNEQDICNFTCRNDTAVTKMDESSMCKQTTESSVSCLSVSELDKVD